MKTFINIKRITKFSYILGIACLLVGMMFSVVTQTGEAATVNGQGNCSTGWVAKDENAPFEYNGSETIIKAIVKSGRGCFPLTISNPNDGCYKAAGLGTNSVQVTQVGTPGPSCQAISHVEFYSGPTDPPPTEPPATEPPATEPPATEPPATEPPATEPPATEPPATEPPATEPPATEPPATETPTDSPATVTPTEPPVTPSPTEPPATPTPPPTLAQPTPMKGTPQVLIPETGLDLSGPKQVFGSQFFMFLGLTFIGLGLIFQGVTKRRASDQN